ncbi:hypothetical protein ACFV2X_02055 [Streptomyces sp. NPDC059679]|uniref:hypothetical protein n=1 Tax=Streptomyces sp. NPDC059679 TaxID=3346903 RepID=UPI003695ECCE
MGRLLQTDAAGARSWSAAADSEPATSYGLTDFHLDEVATKRAMLGNAAHRYVLADSSKFGRTAAHRVCELNGFGTLITDQPCPAELRTALDRDRPSRRTGAHSLLPRPRETRTGPHASGNGPRCGGSCAACRPTC